MSIERQIAQLGERADAVLAHHKRGKRKLELKKYFDDPVGFARDICKFEPHAKQIEAMESVVRGKRTHIRGHHGAGKDAVLAVLMLWACYARGMLVLAISATEKQLLGQLWRELSERFTTELSGKLLSAELRINNKARIVAMTAGTSVSHLTGWHDPNGVFICITEGQGESVEAAAYDAAEGNAVDALSRICVAGNPISASGRFYESAQKDTWTKVRISAFDHPNVQQKRVVIPGGPAPSWPEEMAKEYGAQSPFYISRVEAEFPTTSIDGLIDREWLRLAFERHETAALHDLTWRYRPVLALDPARGVDENALAIVRGPVVEELITWREPDTAKTLDQTIEHARRWWAISRLCMRKTMHPDDVPAPSSSWTFPA
jgi:hypothetical protein